MSQLSTSHVFISYSRRDAEVTRRIVTSLRDQGLKVWVDNEKLVPGTPIWEEEIEKAISGSSAVVAILSPEAKQSIWVRREISLAEQYQKRIFPIMVAGDEDSSIPLRLITNQYVDARKNEKLATQSLKAAVTFYLDEISKTENTDQPTDSDAEKNKDVGSSPAPYFPKPVRETLQKLRGSQLWIQLESYFQPSLVDRPEESWFKRFLLSLFWFLLFLVAPPFGLALVDIRIRNVVMLLWVSVLIFGVVGLYRTWRKEALVTSTAIVGIAFNYMIRRYIPPLTNLPESDVALFWVRVIPLEIFIYFGYKLGRWATRKHRSIVPKSLQDRGFGFLVGAVNGYLIIGTLLYYNHLANYPFENVIPYPIDPALMQSINTMMIYMPPQLLGEPAIYFAVILVIMIMLILLM